MELYTCPKCKAIFPATRFCSFCGEKVPQGFLLERALDMVEAENILGVEVRFPKGDCSDEGHRISAAIACDINKIALSDNGSVLFCSECGKKLPTV